MYIHPKNRPVSVQKLLKMFCFHISRVFTRCLSKMCRLEYRFQNLPAKSVPFLCEWEVYPSHFSPFRNMPASCKRCLSLQSYFVRMLRSAFPRIALMLLSNQLNSFCSKKLHKTIELLRSIFMVIFIQILLNWSKRASLEVLEWHMSRQQFVNTAKNLGVRLHCFLTS